MSIDSQVRCIHFDLTLDINADEEVTAYKSKGSGLTYWLSIVSYNFLIELWADTHSRAEVFKLNLGLSIGLT